MTEKDACQMLEEILFQAMEEGDCEIANIRDFAEAGLLTHNKGLIVKMADGSNFVLTVTKM